MNTRSVGTVATLLALALVVGGCGGADIAGQAAAGQTTSSTAPSANTANPVGVIAIGHSGLTGENSDPSLPFSPALENSWATGTSPSALRATTGLDPRPYRLGARDNQRGLHLPYTGDPLTPTQESTVRAYIDFVRTQPVQSH